nr:unnamed protein product [Naegleria fowleri]
MSKSKLGITEEEEEDFYDDNREDQHDSDDDEIMLIQEDDQALEHIMNEELEEESSPPLNGKLALFEKRKTTEEYRDDDPMQDDHDLMTNISKAMMHDYIGHTIQQICVLFHNNEIPAITSNIYSLERPSREQSSSNFTELILAISVRNTVRFYSLIHNREQMQVKEISNERNHTKALVLESNIKFIKSFDNILVVCDEKGNIHVLKFKVTRIQQEEENTLHAMRPEHELEIFLPFKPFRFSQANFDSSELLSFDAEVLSEGEVITLSLVMGTSNGLLLYMTLSTKSGSSFEALKEQKYQHKSMLPILGVTFAIKRMVTLEIPTLIYYRTLNCVFSIDMNNLEKGGSTLIIRAKDVISSLSVHPLQPNNIILGLSNGALVGKEPNITWEKNLSNTAIKFIVFDEHQKGVVVGDEQGYVYRIEDLTTARHDQKSKNASIGTVLDNIDGHDISYIQSLSENEWFVASPNGRINLVMH